MARMRSITPSNGSAAWAIGRSWRDKFRRFNCVRAGLPPIITIHGDGDDIVPYKQAVQLHAALDLSGFYPGPSICRVGSDYYWVASSFAYFPGIPINAAGGHLPGAIIGIDQNIFDLKIEQFKKVTDLNLHGTVLPTLIFGKSMADRKSGSIINISSMAVQSAITRAVGYSAAKAAIENFTRWMAVEMAQKFGSGIRANAIAPGFLLTEQNRALLTNADGSLRERGKTIINLTPFKRFGNPDELIGTVLWLASDASKFVTGAIIPIDGGFSAFSGV